MSDAFPRNEKTAHKSCIHGGVIFSILAKFWFLAYRCLLVTQGFILLRFLDHSVLWKQESSDGCFLTAVFDSETAVFDSGISQNSPGILQVFMHQAYSCKKENPELSRTSGLSFLPFPEVKKQSISTLEREWDTQSTELGTSPSCGGVRSVVRTRHQPGRSLGRSSSSTVWPADKEQRVLQKSACVAVS